MAVVWWLGLVLWVLDWIVWRWHLFESSEDAYRDFKLNRENNNRRPLATQSDDWSHVWSTQHLLFWKEWRRGQYLLRLTHHDGTTFFAARPICLSYSQETDSPSLAFRIDIQLPCQKTTIYSVIYKNTNSSRIAWYRKSRRSLHIPFQTSLQELILKLRDFIGWERNSGPKLTRPWPNIGYTEYL